MYTLPPLGYYSLPYPLPPFGANHLVTNHQYPTSKHSKMFNQDDVAQLRQKVDVIKTKAQVEGIKEEEAKLCESVEECWDQSRLRVLEKKAEIERVMIIPEDERTEEEMKYETIMTAKRRKNEGE